MIWTNERAPLCLTLLGRVSVVAAQDEAGAGEVRLVGGGEDRVVQPRLPRHGGSQPVQRVAAPVRGGGDGQPGEEQTST